METAEQIEQAAPDADGERQDDGLGAERAPASCQIGSESSAALDAEPVVVNHECGICGFPLSHSSWITHRGLRTHPSCFAKSGEQPDSVSGSGKYGPGGDYFEAARAVVS